MPIIPCNKVIGIINYPKDEESRFKNEKNMSISFLSSGLGASMSPFIGRSDGQSVGSSVCKKKVSKKSVKNLSKTVKEEVLNKT